MATLYIDGEWCAATHRQTRDIHCPADQTYVGTVDEASADDTERAIGVARRTFDEGSWANSAAAERGRILLKVADLLVEHKAEIARAESLDTGKRLVESEYDVDDIAGVFRFYGTIAAEGAGRVIDTGNPGVRSRVVHEPIGVCALITPWNYPLLQTSWKVAPAIAAGCTFVLKPSEITPHTSIILMRLLEQAGVPSGVANLVLGAGPEAGGPLSTDPRVDLVSFTGGLETGRLLMANAAPTVKKVALELGGKNPNIVLDDADFDLAVDLVMTGVFLHSGQVCSAGARLIVHESMAARLIDEIVERAGRITIGGPFDADAETSTLTSAEHLAKVERYVERARADGATVRCGGARLTGGAYDQGYFYPPTVLDGCRSEMACVQDESFGPVLTVETFTSDDEAVALANDSIYGLAGAVITRDTARAERIAARLRMGTVWINDYHPYVPQAEWGGFKQSGTGRELGHHGLDEYREAKHIWHNVNPEPGHWFGGQA